MSVFDENNPITEEFLKKEGFKSYNSGYYKRYYKTKRKSSICDDYYFFIVEVKYSCKYNNLYIEKSFEWCNMDYYKHTISDQTDFYLIIDSYNLNGDI